MSYFLTCYYYFHLINIAILYPVQNCGKSDAKLRQSTNTTYFFGGIFPIHLQDILSESPILLVSSMMLAVQEINESKDILPGIKIGYEIRDSRNDILCACDSALDFLLDNKRNSVLIGVVGPASSSLSVAVSTMLLSDYVPQVSYASTSMSLSQRAVYRNFFRTAPADANQAKALVGLINFFQWTYISLITSRDDYGRFGRDEVLKAATEKNICFSIDITFDVSFLENEIDIILSGIEQNSHVVLLWCDGIYATTIISKSISRGFSNITWIGTESWGDDFLKYSSPNLTHNIILLRLKGYPVDFVSNKILSSNMTSNLNCYNPWYEEFLKKHNWNGITCTPNLTSTLPKRKINQVVGAVYALAYGLHSYLNCTSEKCITLSDAIDYKLLYNHIINASFNVPTSNYRVKFDENGDFFYPAYEYIFVHKNSFTKFGFWEYTFTKSAVLDIDQNVIVWKNNLQPKSVCSLNCEPGTYRVNSSISKCCWICVKCPHGSISSSVNQYECTKCSITSLENLNQTQCIDLSEVSLSIFSTAGILIIIGSISGVLVATLVLILFFIHWNNPVIKSSNREMSCIQLISLKLLFCVAFFYFHRPTPAVCMLRTSLFGFLLTTVVAFVVVKMYRLLRVFNGRFTKVSKFLENKFQITFTFSLVLIQTVTVIVWHAYYPTRVQTVPNSISNEFYLICDNEKSIFLISLIYFFILAIVSGCMAFRARKLPENFNETQNIGYAMFIVCVIWFSYLPLYFSVNPHESVVAFLCTNIFSCYSMLITLYAKKIIYILFNRSLNSVEFFHTCSSENVLHNFVEKVVLEDGSTLNVVRNVIIYNTNANSEMGC
ncbi:metabotropic glutamate receptor 3 isoform X2 [Hydra vulgaris]|uniref:Metabotropic glutamate receptor 3 isoform X2 n=1 Tax=Hydra vulgaris TaxID=6087 RepID=A0ABM4C649_HYDVU